MLCGMADVTHILAAIEQGDPHAAATLLPLVYQELRKLAAARLAEEKPGQTLQATALVHEAYLRLVSNDQPWNGRALFAAAAEAMRRILLSRPVVNMHRSMVGTDLTDLASVDDAAAGLTRLNVLDDALDGLARTHKRKAELVKLRFFAGLTIEQAAAALGVSTTTAENDWAYAKCWLRVALDGRPADAS